MKLVSLQFYHLTHYKTLAHDNSIYLKTFPTKRGKILDVDNKVIASCVVTYKLFLIANTREEFYRTCQYISKFIVLDELPVYKRGVYIPIKSNLNWEQGALLISLNIHGVRIEESFQRVYNYDHLFAHVVGYVSPINERDLSTHTVMNVPGLFLGRGGGIEEFYDQMLRGKNGAIEEEVNAKGHFIRTLNQYNGEAGKDLYTTLSVKLQKSVYKLLESKEDIKSAGVIIIDAHNGDVKTLVSYPSFDPNAFVNGIPSKLWSKLNTNSLKPLFNKVVQGQYPPGSLFKMAVALCALEQKLIKPETKFFCPGYVEFKKRRCHCWAWRRGGHGWVNLRQAIAYSCDSYFYHIMHLLSVQDLLKFARYLGFGRETGVDLSYEKKGRIPSWLEGLREDPMNCVIGQGSLLATLLQMAASTAIFINGGYEVKPRLLKSVEIERKKIDVSSDNLDIIRSALYDTILYGTGKKSAFFINNKILAFGGKTGSSQITNIALKERVAGQLIKRAFHLKDHSLFVGFGPGHKPRYIVGVIIEHGEWGKHAALLAKDIFHLLLEDY